MSFESALWIGVMCGALVYLGTRLAIGKRAETLIGGFVVVGFVVQPWWVSASGYLVGHAVAAMSVGLLRDKVRPRPYLLVALCLANAALMAGGYSNINDVAAVANDVKAKALARYEAGTEADRFVAKNYVPCVDRRFKGIHVYDNGADLPTTCKAATLTIASKSKGDTFAREVSEAMYRWDVDQFGDDADRARLEKSLKLISG